VEDAIVRAKTVYEWVTGQPAPEVSLEAPYARIPPEVDREEHVIRQAATLFEKVRAIAFPTTGAPTNGNAPAIGGADSAGEILTLPAPAAVIRGQDELRYVFELAGVSKDRITVELKGTTLRVSADRPAVAVAKGEQFIGSDLLRARIEQTVQLPIPVEPSAVDASFVAGLLTVRVRIPVQSDRIQKIEVR